MSRINMLRSESSALRFWNGLSNFVKIIYCILTLKSHAMKQCLCTNIKLHFCKDVNAFRNGFLITRIMALHNTLKWMFDRQFFCVFFFSQKPLFLQYKHFQLQLRIDTTRKLHCESKREFLIPLRFLTS